MKPYQYILLIIAIVGGFLVRNYDINSPIADWHSFRQADTASVTRIYSQNGLDFLHPKYHDLSDVQSGQENPQGYRMVEAPIYNTVSLYFHQLTHQNIEVSSRLVSIFFSLGSALLIFFIAFRLTGLFLPAFFSFLVFLFLPFNIYYSRTILPEPTAVFFMILTLFLFQRQQSIFASISLTLALLLKPYTGIILFPSLVVIILTHQNFYFKPKEFIKLVFFSLISLIPFILWRRWILQFPAGIPKSDWLFNDGITTTFPLWWHGHNLTFLNKLVAFRPHWWYWLFQERLTSLILGTFGIIPFFLGFIFKKGRTQLFTLSFFVGILAYFVIVAQGNIQHDYYQVLIIPFISMILGFGYYYLYRFTFDSKILTSIIVISLFSVSIFLSWDQIKGYYQINHPQIIDAGLKAASILPKNSLIIAPYQGDTSFLYQTGFSGWPTEIYDIPNKVKEHPYNPLYLVSVNYDQYTNSLIPKYPTVIRNNDFIILKLSP